MKLHTFFDESILVLSSGKEEEYKKRITIYTYFKKGGRMMNTSIIRKEELINLLNEINNELGRLEVALSSCTSHKYEEWQKNQDISMDRCEKQLDSIEMNVQSIEALHNQYYKNRLLRLELTS